MSFGNLITTTAASISSGGTINGSLTIDGDLTVNGDGSGNYDEIVNGNLTVSSTNKLVLGGDGSDTYLQESGADVLDIYVGGANMIKLTESSTDTMTVTGALTIGSDGSGHDVTFYSGTAGDSFVWDASEEKLTITGTNGQVALAIPDGNVTITDDLDVDGTTNLDIVDIDGAVDMASTLAVGDNVSISNASADKPVLQIENTNADNSSGTIKFVKNPTDSSEADADMLGGIYYYGNDDANNSTNYAFTRVKSTDVSNGSEDGEIDWAVMANGSMSYMTFKSGQLGVGTESPSYLLDVSSSASETYARIKNTSSSGQAVLILNNDVGNWQVKCHTDDTFIIRDNGNARNHLILDANSRISLSNNDSGTSNTVFGKLAGASIDAGSNYNTFIGENVSDATMNDATYNIGIGFEALGGLTTGDSNTVVGSYAYTLASTGLNNVAIGHGAMNQVPAGQAVDGVVAVGFEALKGHSSNTTTGINGTVAIGDSALLSLTSGAGNVAIGYQAGDNLDAGNYNTILGHQALSAEDGHGYNVAVGYQALLVQNAGADVGNVAIGYQAGKAITTGARNLAIGKGAMDSLTVGDDNVAIGYDALGTMAATDNNDKNIAIGSYALANAGASSNVASDNVAIGYSAGVQVTTADNSTFIGSNAGAAITTGASNMAIGSAAMDAAQTSQDNIAIGAAAMGNINHANSNENVVIGNYAGDGMGTLDGNANNILIGQHCGGGTWTSSATSSVVAIGHYALDGALDNVDGTVAIGASALGSLTSGASNVAIGYQSMTALTTGASNIAIGGNTLDAADGGETGNIAIGDSALGAMDEGSGNANYNIGIGHLALTGGAGNADMTGIIAIGANALNSTGTNSETGAIAIGYECLTAMTTGGGSTSGNVAIGYQAAATITDGSSNVSIGYQAMASSHVSSTQNVVVGRAAMQNSTGSASNYNTGIGHGIFGGTMNAASNNTAVGHSALGSITQAVDSVAIGYNAGANVTTGGNQIFIGRGAGEVHTTGGNNIAIGTNAMNDTDHGDCPTSIHNIFIGTDSGGGTWQTNDSNKNVAVGNYTMDAAMNDAQDNTALGTYSLSGLTSGDFNVCLGSASGQVLTTGSNNILCGFAAGDALTVGDHNVAIGYNAFGSASTTDGIDSNIAIGSYALDGTAGEVVHSAIAIGYGAMTGACENEVAGSIAIGRATLGAVTTGGNNVAIGYRAAEALTTGSNNTVIGYEAFDAATLGEADNVSIGYGSMGAVDVGSGGGTIEGNVAIGRNALNGGAFSGNDRDLIGNVAIGYQSLDATGTTACVGSTAVGHRTLSSANATTAQGSTAFGYKALETLTSGAANLAVGYQAGDTITTGSGNTYIGMDADASANSVSDEIVLKAGSDALVGGGTETVRIGVDSDYITNDFDINATWTHSSDERIKKDISDNELGLDFINDIRTVTFKKKAPSEYPEEFEQYNPSKTERKNPDRINYGFIAQEVKKAMDKAGHSEFPVWSEQSDGMQELGEAEFITPLIKAVQELSAKVEELEAKLK